MENVLHTLNAFVWKCFVKYTDADVGPNPLLWTDHTIEKFR